MRSINPRGDQYMFTDLCKTRNLQRQKNSDRQNYELKCELPATNRVGDQSIVTSGGHKYEMK